MKFLFIGLVLCCFVAVQTHEFKGFTLKFLLQILNGDFTALKSRKDKTKDTKLRNISSIYLEHLQFADFRRCSIYEINEAEKRDKRAKCLRAKGNGTMYLLNNLNAMQNILSTEPGNCVVILFFTKFCPGCQALIPHWSSLARNFVDIKVAAIDALEHSGLNTDFGIIGLPSIVLFHQGRMVQKFNTTNQGTVVNVIKFIETHTNLKPASTNIVVTSDDFSATSLLRVAMYEEAFDVYLLLSWIFIIICAIYYFTKSRTFVQIVEMINRTWRESNEAQLQ